MGPGYEGGVTMEYPKKEGKNGPIYQIADGISTGAVINLAN